MQSPFLTTKELAARWHCTGWTVSTRYRALGLKPLKFGEGDGHLQYYLYNWRCPTVTPNNVGLVLL